jgi:hypothetical protein
MVMLFFVDFYQYHVQFYGEECHHGWVNEGLTLEFAGREAFDQRCKAEKKKKRFKMFSVSGSRIDAWNQAAAAAEVAFGKDRGSRLADLVQYVNDRSADAVEPRKKKCVKRKLQEMRDIKMPLTKRQKLDTSFDAGFNVSLSSPELFHSANREQSSVADLAKSDLLCSGSTRAIPPGVSVSWVFFRSLLFTVISLLFARGK